MTTSPNTSPSPAQTTPDRLVVTERLLRFVGWQWRHAVQFGRDYYIFVSSGGFEGAGWEACAAPTDSDWFVCGLNEAPDLFDADSAEGALWREKSEAEIIAKIGRYHTTVQRFPHGFEFIIWLSETSSIEGKGETLIEAKLYAFYQVILRCFEIER